MTKRLAMALALTGAVLLATAGPAAAQCAMCQTTLTGSPEGRAMAGEFNKAILVMLAAPYLVFGTFLAVAFRHRIRPLLAAKLKGLSRPIAY